MKAFFSDAQRKHAPQQFFWVGRIVQPLELEERIDALLAALGRLGIEVSEPQDYGVEPLLSVHAAGYLEFLQSAYARWSEIENHGDEVLPSHHPFLNGVNGALTRPACRATSIVGQAGYYLGDLSCPVGPDTWEAALRSAHSALAAAEAVMDGDRAAYALCRPAGHHAHADSAAGFCYVNTSALAAQRLRQRFASVAVLDIDVHHGNGTQQIFYARPDVMTLSLHASPQTFYPFFEGYADERGYGEGLGCNINYELPSGTSDEAWLAAFDDACHQLQRFGAEALVVALGFDAHRDDPLGVLELSDECYAEVGRRLAGLGLPVVLCQEGGYAPKVLERALQAFMQGFVR